MMKVNDTYVNCYFKTTYSKQSFKFKWTIKKFPNMPYNRKVRSTDFCPFDDENWSVILKKSVSANLDQKLHVYFNGKVNENEQLSCKIVFRDDKSEFEGEFQRNFPDEDYFLNLSHYINYINADTIFMFFTITLHKCISIEGFCDYLQPSSTNDHLKELSHDLYSMLTSPRYSNIAFKVGNRVFPAHKSILAERSSVFNTMFFKYASKKVTEVVIDDIEPKIFFRVLEYLYTGSCNEIDYETALALYCYASDKHKVTNLREKCRTIMLENLREDNANMMLSLARHHDDNYLVLQVTNFVKLSAQPDSSM